MERMGLIFSAFLFAVSVAGYALAIRAYPLLAVATALAPAALWVLGQAIAPRPPAASAKANSDRRRE
jgi:hypothetical protein